MPKILASEIEDAGAEDVLRSTIENTRALQGATIAAERNHQANGRLRDSIRRAKSSAFADFERSVRGGPSD